MAGVREADQDCLGAGGIGADEAESHAILRSDASLGCPGLGFVGEEVGEGTEAAVTLQENKAVERDFLTEGFGDEFGLFGRGAGRQSGRKHDLIEQCSSRPGAQAGIKLFQRSETGTAGASFLP